jgi:hypothetical protein
LVERVKRLKSGWYETKKPPFDVPKLWQFEKLSPLSILFALKLA